MKCSPTIDIFRHSSKERKTGLCSCYGNDSAQMCNINSIEHSSVYDEKLLDPSEETGTKNKKNHDPFFQMPW